jgi:hypothetical protein
MRIKYYQQYSYQNYHDLQLKEVRSEENHQGNTRINDINLDYIHYYHKNSSYIPSSYIAVISQAKFMSFIL